MSWRRLADHPVDGGCMSPRSPSSSSLTAAVLFGGIGLATRAAAQASDVASSPGSGRAGANVALVVALISVVAGGLALARSAGSTSAGNGRTRAIAALVVGLTGMALGGLHVVRSTGGIGTGNGRGGAIVALAMGLIGMVLGGLALARSRRTD